MSSPATARAASVTLNPVADTGLFENQPDNNLGGMSFVPVGTRTSTSARNRGLFRFDVAGNVPSGAQITSASVEFRVTFSSLAPTVPFDLHGMLVDWIEGDNTGGPGGGNVGSPANAGEPSWNHRAAPSTPWGEPGCLAGTDYAMTPSATQNMPSTGSATFSSATLTSDVQNWLDDPSSNYGWLLKVQDEVPRSTARRIGTRDGRTGQPVLTIEFQTVPTLEIPTVSGDAIQFRFHALTGQAYEVLRRDTLGTGAWNTFTNIGPENMDVDVSVFDTIAQGVGFYQILVP